MTESTSEYGTEDMAARYIAVWNEADAQSRQQSAAELWTEEGTYTDPLADAKGHEQIAKVISAVRHQFPQHVFRLIGEQDAHHNVVRFRWELVPEDGGESVVEGSDVAIIAEDGRVKSVLGFLDKVPAT